MSNGARRALHLLTRGVEAILLVGRARLKLSLPFICITFGSLAAAAFGQDLGSLAKQIRYGNTEQKRDALLQIRNLRSEEASRIAVVALSDRNEIVRATAASSIVFLPKAEAASLLIGLLKDKAAFVRKEAAYALGETGDTKTVPGEGNTDRITNALWLVLQSDKDIEVRSAAAIALGSAGGLRSVAYLSSVLQERPTAANEFLRRSSVRSIGTVAERIRSGARVMSSLPETSETEDHSRMDYAKIFPSFGSAARLLTTILKDKIESGDVRREAAWALGNIGDLSSVPVLEANLNSDDPYLAKTSEEALRKLRNIKPS